MKKNSKSILFLVLTISALPLIFSWVMYFYHDHFTLRTNNRGILLNPPITVSDLHLEQKKWQIVFVPSHCNDEHSDKLMFFLHQLRRSLGQNQNRVSLTLLVSQTCQLDQTHDFRKVMLTTQQYQQLQQSLNLILTDKIYLVDPLDNFFMYYPSTTNPMNIFDDLKKVLGVSQIG